MADRDQQRRNDPSRSPASDGGIEPPRAGRHIKGDDPSQHGPRQQAQGGATADEVRDRHVQGDELADDGKRVPGGSDDIDE